MLSAANRKRENMSETTQQRPDIAPERWAVWTARLDEPGYECAKAQVQDEARGNRYFAGVWLYEELRARKVGINESRERCYASGASVMAGRDPWESAMEILRKEDMRSHGTGVEPPLGVLKGNDPEANRGDTNIPEPESQAAAEEDRILNGDPNAPQPGGVIDGSQAKEDPGIPEGCEEEPPPVVPTFVPATPPAPKPKTLEPKAVKPPANSLF